MPRKRAHPTKRPAPPEPRDRVHASLAFFGADPTGEADPRHTCFQTALLAAIGLHQMNAFPQLAAIIWVLAFASLAPGLRRLAAATAFLVIGARALSTFPDVSNHSFLEVLLLWLLIVPRAGLPRERALLLQSLRWLTVLIFLYAGVHKVWYGEYFDGRLFVLLAAGRPVFADALQPLLTSADLSHLATLRPTQVGSGPYLLESSRLATLANASWLAEIFVGLLLFVPRTRAAGALAGAATIIVIEVFVREVTFGLIMLDLLLCFGPTYAHRVGATVIAVVAATLTLVKLGFLPGPFFV